MHDSTSATHTGYTIQTRVRLRRSRRARTIIHTASASTTGGQTHPSSLPVGANTSTMTPATAMNSRGHEGPALGLIRPSLRQHRQREPRGARRSSSTEPVMTGLGSPRQRAGDEEDRGDETPDQRAGDDATDVAPGRRGFDDVGSTRGSAPAVVSWVAVDVMAMVGLPRLEFASPPGASSSDSP